MKETRLLKIGDTMVFDHSDYTDYCVVISVNEEGTEGKMACVDDGCGFDVLWFLPVRLDKESGKITTYQDRDVSRDDGLFARAGDCIQSEDEVSFEALLVELVNRTAKGLDGVCFEKTELDDVESAVEELKANFNEIRANNKDFDECIRTMNFHVAVIDQYDEVMNVNYTLTKEEKDLLDDVMNDFDFGSLDEKINQMEYCMPGSDGLMEIPTVYELVKIAEALLTHVIGGYSQAKKPVAKCFHGFTASFDGEMATLDFSIAFGSGCICKKE